MASLHDYYNSGDDGYWADYGSGWLAQTFTATAEYTVTSVKLKLFRTGSPGTITASIRATDEGGLPTGSDLQSATGTTDGNTLTDTGSGEWREFTLSASVPLNVSTQYAIIIRISGGDTSNKFWWKYDDSSPTYTTGNIAYSANSGSSWTESLTRDFMFEVWGIGTIPTEKIYSRKFVAIGNNEVWYETSAGTMEELTDANGDIDCSQSLMALEAYQKIFIVNKTNLKVADFVNTKIATDDAGEVVCTRGMTLTGGTSAASMIVDYVDAVTDDAAMNVYGYRTTTATFSSGETVTGTNSAGATVSFVTSAAETAPHHWYNWTVFGNDTTTYGTMPTSSSIIALYRGRIVYNDDLRPHAWYMSAVENPWKIKYDYDTDGDLSAITYTNTRVGEVGDILTAIIPYKDDLLIWGCANSIWILVGDPMGSGQNARITDKTGIWGSRSWCIDDKSNLYFLGDDGIYKMPVSESYSPPENISKLVLPNLITDLDLDKSLHRVVFEFDPIGYGIHICKTLLSDGTNTNYWFDLMTGGFYPENYPASCGVFSSYYYPATDDTYKKYLVGCADGYIREFDNSTKNDTTTSSTSAIDSYCTIINKLSPDEDTEGKMTWINAITAGGATGGNFSDTDTVDYSLYTGDDAESVLEKVKATTAWATGTVYAVGDLVTYSSTEYRCITAHTSDEGGPPNEEPDTNTTDWLATAFATGTWTGPGKQTKNRTRMRGGWYGIKLRNNDASETWGINSLYCNIEKAGKLR